MPYIAVHCSQDLSADKKEQIKSEIGRLIELIPGKNEDLLMLEFFTGVSMARSGIFRDDLVYLDVRCFKPGGLENNKNFTEAVCESLKSILALQEDSIYLTITEYNTWGTRGSLKSWQPDQV